jgi:desulfoferrodoxin-like iron-binding protein
MVNVRDAGEVYVCPICGNVVLVREAGGGELVCHGESMELKR